MSKTRMYRLKIGRWRLVLANCRLKKMNPAGRSKGQNYSSALAAARRRRYKLSDGCCEVCGRPIALDDADMHHVLPYAEFPQYGTNPQNLDLLCEDCHHTIHMNPYENLRRMEQKAREFGFDLKEYYTKRKKS